MSRIDYIGLNGNTGEHYGKRECDKCDRPDECENCIHDRRGNEKDPSGLDPHSNGAKLDAGKPRASLVLGGFSRALLAVSEVGTFGANKYSDNGWKSVDSGLQRYSDAMLRHYLYEAEEEFDRDSGLRHAAHLAWNALARLEFLIEEKENG